MKVSETSLKGILMVEPHVYGDKRGYFLELYHSEKYNEAGIDQAFVQDNLSLSRKGILRGLHFQLRKPQGKLVQVVKGEVFDVAVDIRKGSPNFGKWFGTILDDKNNRQLYIPPGFAHGFCVLSELAYFVYKCTDFYDPDDEYGVAWNDPEVNIDWPTESLILSEKDQKYPFLKEILPDLLPDY